MRTKTLRGLVLLRLFLRMMGRFPYLFNLLINFVYWDYILRDQALFSGIAPMLQNLFGLLGVDYVT
jgi:hypothetical protein